MAYIPFSKDLAVDESFPRKINIKIAEIEGVPVFIVGHCLMQYNLVSTRKNDNYVPLNVFL